MHPLRAHIDRFGADRCLVLVPRQTAARALMRELTTDGTPLFGLRIETPATLIQRIIPQIPNIGLSLEEFSAEAVVGDIAGQMSSSTPIPLLNLLTRPSGQRVALATMKELRFNGYSPEMLRRTESSTLRTLADIMERYDDFCGRIGAMDWATQQLAAIDALENDTASFGDFDCLIVSSFSVAQHHIRRLIRALAKGRETILDIPMDRDRESLFADGVALADSLESAEMLGVDSADSDTHLAAFKRAIFASKRSSVPEAAASLGFHSVPGRFDEVEAAAIEIDRLLSEGVAPSAIGLTTRTLTDYDRFISTVFERFNIPYFYRRGAPMLHSPVIRLAMKLTELGEDVVRFDALLGVLRSRFMPFGKTTALRERILKGEVHTESPEGWLRIINRFEEEGQSNSGFAELLERCIDLHRDDGAHRTNRDFLTKFAAIVEEYISNALENLKKSDKEEIRKKSDESKKHIEAFSDLLKNLDAEVNRLRGWGLADIDPLHVLRDRISNETITEEHPPQEAVNVFNFFDMGYQRVDHLFVVGMDEHSVPRSTPNIGLLAENELAALEVIRDTSPHDFGKVADALSRRRAEEQAFILALNSARQSIDLYTPSLDSEGKELIPSPYFSECMWIAGVDEPAKEPGGDIRSLADVQPDRYSIRRQLLRHLYRTDIDVDEQAARTLLGRMLDTAEESDFISGIGEVLNIEESRRASLFHEQGAEFDKWTGRIESPVIIEEIAKEFGDDHCWSPTALQAYADSPFAFFVQQVLRLKELCVPQEEGDPRNIGKLYHDVLQRFVEKTAEQFPLKEFEDASKSIESSIKAAFEQRFGSAESIKLDILKRLYFEQSTAIMKSFFHLEKRHEGNKPFPERLEYRFGNDDCIIELPQMKIRLEGIFDRVDLIDSDGKIRLEIIDYKKRLSDTRKPTPGRVEKGENLQLPVYLLAASKLFGVDLEEVRGRLIGLENNKEYSIEITPRKYGSFMGTEPGSEETIYELIQKYIKGIRSGDFRVEDVPKGLLNLVGRWRELPPELEN